MKNRIDDASKTLNHTLVELTRTKDLTIDAYEGLEKDLAYALDDDGLLMPDLPGPDGYNAGLPWWGACDTEVRPAGYEQRVICTDENGPWEATAQDAREFAYALLAAADYAERIQE